MEYIRVLHVDDDARLREITSKLLEERSDRINVTTARNTSEALVLLEEKDFNCVVSDYDMPRKNGIEFLQTVRDEYGSLPFILFTSKGSEEIASEAISEGVTDYLQKETTTDQFTLLANRIENAVSQYRAEKKVERTQERFSKLHKHSADYILTVNTDGVVEYATPSVERVLGYEPDEIIGTSAFEYAHPDDMEKANEKFEKIVESSGNQITAEFRIKHKDGSWRWVEVRGRNLIDDPVIGGIVVNVREVTERKEREQELRQLKEEYETVFENAQDSLFLIDVNKTDSGVEFVYRRHNSSHETTSGLSMSELQGKTPKETLGDKTGGKVEEHFRRCFEKKEEITYEEKIDLPAGTIISQTKLSPIVIDDQVTQIVGIARDITDQRKRERRLERYKNIVESTEDGIYVFNENAEFEFVNQRVVDVSGIPRGDWIGEHVSIHTDLGTLTSEEVNSIETAVEELIQGDEKERRIELAPNVPHELQTLELRLTSFEVEDTKRVIGFSRDITERKEYEREVERRRDN